MVTIKLKRLTETATMPTKAHTTDACYDIYLDEPDSTYNDFQFNGDGLEYVKGIPGVSIPAHSSLKLHTGFATEIPAGYFCAVYPRSSVGCKMNVRLANSTGIIDSDYRGEWLVTLFNDSDDIRVFHHGDRIAQFAVLPVIESELIETDELSNTERGTGGFGSTGR